MKEMISLNEVHTLIKQELETLANENKLNSLEKIRGNFRLVETTFEA